MKKIAIFIGILLATLSAGVSSASLYDWYAQQGLKLPSVSERTPLATQCGISNYVGLKSQNIALEACLRGNQMLGGTPTPTSSAPRVYIESPDWQLYNGAAAGDTTLTLDDLEDIYGTDITMGSATKMYGRINPDGTGESISFSGITTNSDGTKTLTGVKTVLAQYPYTETSGLARSHSIGSLFRLTNTAGFYNDLANKENAEIIENIWTYNDFPVVSTTTALPTTNGQFATKYYVDTVGAGGFTSVNVSTTRGLSVDGSSPEKVGINASSTTGMAFDSNGKLYQKIDTTTGIQYSSGSAGIGINTSTLVSLIATSTPTANKIPIANASGTLPNAWFSLLYSFFGTGQDGDVVISANTTSTKDMYYNNLTINTGVVLVPNGYKIYVKDTLTFVGTGKIAWNGNNGTAGTGTGAKGVAGTTLSANTVYGSGSGGDGAVGVADPGIGATGSSAATTNPSIGVSGGAGGAGGGTNQVAASVGGASATTSAKSFPYDMFTSFMLVQTGSTITQLQGSASGAGGGAGSLDNCGAGSSKGGGGGGGGTSGGIVSVYAKNIITVDGNIYLQSKGGNGGAGGDGTCYSTCATPDPAGGGGGGGAGSGGVVNLIYATKTGSGTIDVSAGSAGAGGGKIDGNVSDCGSPRNIANAGAAGGAGATGTQYILKITL